MILLGKGKTIILLFQSKMNCVLVHSKRLMTFNLFIYFNLTLWLVVLEFPYLNITFNIIKAIDSVSIFLSPIWGCICIGVSTNFEFFSL